MFSRVFITSALFMGIAALLVSGMVAKLPEEEADQNPLQAQELMVDPQGRIFFGNLFNLSAALANAPANMSALGFVPLGSLLFGAAG